MNKKKIIFFSTGRADFYLLSNIIKEFKNTKKFKTFLAVTGNHFDKKYGKTFKDIKKNGFKIDYKVPYILKKDNKEEIIKEIGKSFLANFKILKKLNPDILVILGDRFELISIVNTAIILNIPIAHIHGGEVTEGAFDDLIRHSVTKLSNIHFVTNQIHKKRLINMGENPKNVYDVGGIGAELISKEKKYSKKYLEKFLGIKLNKKLILVSLHPETNSKNINYTSLFSALKKIRKEFIIIFTSPNSDPGNEIIFKEIFKFNRYENSYHFSNLGSELFHSLMRVSSMLIGNSSSGIMEAPLLNIPTINIGNRQKGRLLENSILNCQFKKNEILKSILLALKKNKKSNKIKYHINKKASEIIFKTLIKLDLNSIRLKKFNDVK